MVMDSGSMASSAYHSERNRSSIMMNTMTKLPSSASSIPRTMSFCHTTFR